MAKRLESYNWEWLEAPVSDYDYNTYKRLVKNTDLEISSHGNCLLTLQEVTYALSQECGLIFARCDCVRRHYASKQMFPYR
ncbi:hypothetical protein JCM19052_3290 [Vibrio sp. JCM 19052]|nr:hypothetical protein JCM19052_3290 [Vibrio sp. JCM 19052]